VSSARSGAPLASLEKARRNSALVIHVFVALADNVNQGIVPVSPALGNGDDPARNLYWGAAFGVKRFFGKNKDWSSVPSLVRSSSEAVLERVFFKHGAQNVFLVADAYRGSEIKRATEDFLKAAAGVPGETVTISDRGKEVTLYFGGSANLIAYVGHNGLMDFRLTSFPQVRDREKRDTIILACASKSYFADALRPTGANPVLWTTNLMAPEAYVLSAAIDGWLAKENGEQIRLRAAKAYDQYQNCGLKGATLLFATGW
jgi:hypothetical protein